MDPDSSSKFIGSLTKFLQSLCNGYVEFEDGVELIGHIYLSVDTGKKGKKIDYILNEKVCKSDNSVTFISNSFHALPDKAKRDDSEVSDIGDGPPRSTNTGTVPSRSQQSRSAPSPNQRSGVHTGSKRPGSPLKGPQPSQRRAHSPPSQRRLISSAGRPPSGSPASKTVPSSPSSSSQDNIPSPSPGKKGRSEAATSEPPSNQSDNADIEDIPSNVLSINPTPDFASFLGSLTSDNQSTHKSPRDTKPDTDVTFIKEEFVSEPSSCAQAGSSGHSGRSGEENGGGLYPVMLHQNTSVFPSTSAGYPPGFSSNASSTATSQSAFPGSSTSQSDMFNPVPGTSQDGADPSGGAGAASDDDVQIVRDNLLPSMQLMVTSSDDAHLFFYMTDSQLAENQSQQPTTQVLPSSTQYVAQEQSTLGDSHSVSTERESIANSTDQLPPAGDVPTSQVLAEGQLQAEGQQDQQQEHLEPEEIPEQKPLISSTGAVIDFSQPSITFLSQALHNYDSYSDRTPFSLPTFNQNSQPFSEESSQNFEQAPQYEVVDFKYDVAYLLNTYAQDENLTSIAGPTPLSTAGRQPFSGKGPRGPSLSKTAYRGNTAKRGKRFGYRMVPSQSLKEPGTSGTKHWRGLQGSWGRGKGASSSSKSGLTKLLKGLKYQGPRRTLTSSGERQSSSIKGRSGSTRRSDDVKHSDSSLADKEQQFHCEKCGKAYINDGWLERHQLTCSGLMMNSLKAPGTTYTCAYCERILQNYSWYVRHTNLCRKGFGGKKQKNNVEQDLACKKCNRKFATLNWLVRHSNLCEEALGESTKEDKEKQKIKDITDKVLVSSSFIKNQEVFKCVKCKKEFGSYSWMMRHSKVCLAAKAQEKTERLKSKEDSPVVTGGPAKKYEEHKCEKCKKEFGSFSWLRRHIKICSGLQAPSLHKKFGKTQPLKWGKLDTLKLINPPSQKLTKSELPKLNTSESSKVTRPSNVCPGCKKNFKWKSYLERHSKYCRGSTRQMHSCEKCHRSFGSLSWLMRHRHFSKCSASSLDQVNGKSRKEKDTGPNEEHRETSDKKPEAAGCRKCGRVFKYQGFLKRHEEECSMGDNAETADGTVSCKDCGKVVSSVGYLKQHLPSCSKVKGEKAEVQVKIPIKTDLSCRKCGKKYIYKPVLLRHEKDCMASGSDGASDFVCGKCGKKYMYMPMLIRHEERCMGPPPVKRSSADLACKKCGKRYTYELMLLRHERLCLDIPPSSSNASRIACLKCGKKYAYFPVLLRHERFCRGHLKNLTKLPASTSASQLSGAVTNPFKAASESLTPAESSLQVSISKTDMAAANTLATTSSDIDLSALPGSSNSYNDEHISSGQCKNCGELFASRELLQNHEKMSCRHMNSGAAVAVNDNVVLVNLNADEIEHVSPVAVETEDVHLDAAEMDNLSPVVVAMEDVHLDAVEMKDIGPDDVQKEVVNPEVDDTEDMIADNIA